MLVSENEYKIMALMWKANQPLSRAEILKGTEGRNWNPASIHLILNAMLSKRIIKITDDTKNYGRTYEPVITYEEYLMEALKTAVPDKDISQIIKDVSSLRKKKSK